MNGTPTILGILIIDDNASWAEGVKRIFETRLPESNRQVRWESSMSAGLQALKSFHADVVWLDLDLPDSRPYETIPRIKEFPSPVYVLSDHFDKKHPTASAIATECMKAGAHRVYPKDIETVEFLVGDIAQAHVHHTFNGTRS